MAAAVLPLLLLLLAAPAAYAAQHVVGGAAGWSLSGDYATWAAGQTFTVGDTLLFNYDSSHGVDEVNQADYSNCATGNAISTYSGGKTSINLTTAGNMYFICPTIGHCSGGMKLQIKVVGSGGSTPAAPSGTPPATPSSPPSSSGRTPSTPATTTESPPPPATPSGAASNFVNMNVLGLGTLLALIMVC
ncbi:uclacyanin-3-like [Malania oleifera]|uniref:uclacyanin-3-like n=1 Tax=Malania oleifera TaxID=397392 RepID=UPI0025AE4057|nr:uclacyanin-3-like [Malania oleifera]